MTCHPYDVRSVPNIVRNIGSYWSGRWKIIELWLLGYGCQLAIDECQCGFSFFFFFFFKGLLPI